MTTPTNEAAEPRTEAGREMETWLREPEDYEWGRKVTTAILAIEREASEAAPSPGPSYSSIRKAITDSYYDCRNAGRTMETAADLAATRVSNLLSQARSAAPSLHDVLAAPLECDDPAGHLAALCDCYLEAEGAWHEFVNLVYRLIPDGDIRGPIIGAAARLSSQPSTEPAQGEPE